MINDIEKSITKTYRKIIWKKVLKAIEDYKLIKENDKIAVCISGGKDSFLLALTLKELQKHSKYNFDLVFLVMDPGYEKHHLEEIINNAKKLNLDIKIFESNIFNDVKDEKAPCYLCARKRRGHLYSKALELGCNKIALGHHFDDVIETILLNILYAGSYGSMLPKLKSDHYKGMELIRPLYLVRENDVIKWANYNKLSFLNCACSVSSKKVDSKRLEMKNLIKELSHVYKDIPLNIFRSSDNINLSTVLGYNKNKIKKSFLDDYDIDD